MIYSETTGEQRALISLGYHQSYNSLMRPETRGTLAERPADPISADLGEDETRVTSS
jgi:hypothetical protein